MMEQAILTYFAQEKSAMIYLFAAGMLSAVAALLCLLRRGDWLPSAGLLGLLATVQLLVSAIVTWRSDTKAGKMLGMLVDNPQQVLLQEGARLAGVLDRFVWFKGLEILVAGLCVFLLVKSWHVRRWRRFYLCLLLQAMAMFVVDHQAEQRAAVYFDAIQTVQSENR